MSTSSITAAIGRPEASEFNPYFGRYIDQVPDNDPLGILESQLEDTVALLDSFGEAGASTRYAPGKWSVKQVVGHVTDTERIFGYRGLCAARSEGAGLPGFDENAYVAAARFDERTLNSLMGELTAVRRATLSLFRNLEPDELARCVTSNNAPLSARAALWIIAGHERHHATLLRERYLPVVAG